MKTLVLYSTDHCALCEEALEALFSMPELQGWALKVIDVAADPDLLERYGERIPVLSANGIDYDGPFDRGALAAFLRQ